MISPARTFWPPNRFTPRRCAFESRPLRVELAPFLCAISASLPGLLDSGDLDAREVLTVPLALLVAGLVLELLDHDLGAALFAEHLGSDGHLRELVDVGRDRVAVYEQNGGQFERVAHLRLLAVEDDDRSDLDLLLPTTGAHYCVNHFTPVSSGSARLRLLCETLSLRDEEVMVRK